MIKKIPKAFFYIMVAMLFIILFFVMLNVTSGVRRVISRSLRPVFYGMVIAYLLKPMCNFFEKRYTKIFIKKFSYASSKKASHYLSMVTTYIIFGAIVFFFLWIIIPQLVTSVIKVVSQISGFYNTVVAYLNQIVAENPFLAENLGHIIEAAYAWYTNSFLPLLTNLINGITGGIMVTFTFIVNLVIGFIVSVYLLNGRKKIGAQAKMLIKGIFNKKEANLIFNEVKFADRMFSGYFAGTLIDSTLIAVICYILCRITSMPLPLLIAFIVGVANIIPFFGPYIGMMFSVPIIIAASENSIKQAVIFIIMIWILQQVDGNIIAPKIIGSNTGLSSFWVLFAILLFGGLFGFFGMIIGSPIFAVIYDIAGKLIRKSATKKGEGEFIKKYENEFLSNKDKPPLRERIKNKFSGDKKAGGYRKTNDEDVGVENSDNESNDIGEEKNNDIRVMESDNKKNIEEKESDGDVLHGDDFTNFEVTTEFLEDNGGELKNNKVEDAVNDRVL